MGGVGGRKVAQSVLSGISSVASSRGTILVLCCQRCTETSVASGAAGALLLGGVEGGPVGRGVFSGELGQEGGISSEGDGTGTDNDVGDDVGSGVESGGGRSSIPMVSTTHLKVFRVFHIALNVSHVGTKGSGPVGSEGGGDGGGNAGGDSGGDAGGDGGGDAGSDGGGDACRL